MNFFKQCITTYLSSAKRKPLLYLLIVILQLISLCSVFFSIGLIANANSSFLNADLAERFICFKTMEDFSEDGDYLFEDKSDKAYEMCMPITKASEGVKMLEDVLGDNLIDVKAWGFIKMPDNIFPSCLTYYVFNNYDIYNPTMQTETVDENTILFHPSVEIPDEWKLSDNKLRIDGREYSYSYCQREMAAYVEMSCGYNTPSSVRCYEFYIDLRQPMQYSVFKKVENIIDSYFEAVDKEMPKVPDLLESQMSNTQIAVAAAFIAVSVLNCSLCYNYIYNSRKKQLSIYRICGATTAECIIIYLTEVVICSLVAFGASLLMFEGLLKNFVLQMYPLSEPVFTASNYLTIFAIYIILTIFIMLICIVSFVKKPIIEERK